MSKTEDDALAKELRAIADDIANYDPIPESFKGVRNAAAGAKIGIRMTVELLRERADQLQGVKRQECVKSALKTTEGGGE